MQDENQLHEPKIPLLTLTTLYVFHSYENVTKNYFQTYALKCTCYLNKWILLKLTLEWYLRHGPQTNVVSLW